MKHTNRQKTEHTAAENTAPNAVQNPAHKNTHKTQNTAPDAEQNTVHTAAHHHAQNSCRTGPEKTEAPAHLHDQMKTGTRGTYILAPLMNKLTGNTFPDGDVLRIDRAAPAEEIRTVRKPVSRPAAACRIPQRYIS